MIETSSRLDMRALRSFGASLLLFGIAAAPLQHAHAQTARTAGKESSVTVYGGYRFGGTLTEATTNSTIDLKGGSSAAVAIDIGLDRQTQVQLFYSHQNTALTSGAFSAQVNNMGLTLHNYHVGGTYFIEEVGHGLYVVGGIGATTATPDRGDLNSETFFSGNLGVGWMVPLGRHAGLRFEARGYGILVDNDSATFCGGNVGCVVSIKGTTVYQGEVLVGLSIRF
jgi:hypothetical protein